MHLVFPLALLRRVLWPVLLAGYTHSLTSTCTSFLPSSLTITILSVLGRSKKEKASEFDSLFVLGGMKGPWKKKSTPADQAATILLVLPVLSVFIQLVFSTSTFFSPRVESCRFIGGFARGPFRSVCLLRYLSCHFRVPGFIYLSGPTRAHERPEFVRAHGCRSSNRIVVRDTSHTCALSHPFPFLQPKWLPVFTHYCVKKN